MKTAAVTPKRTGATASPALAEGEVQAAWEVLARQLVREAPAWGLDPAAARASIRAEPDAATVSVARLLVAAEWVLRGSMEGLIEAMLPQSSVPSPAAVLQARRNAAARETLLQEFGALTSSDIAELAGSKASNRAALANRWKQEGRIFAVSHGGATYYPGFQFDEEGRPREAVARAISALSGKLSDWGLALWWTGANGFLDGARPVDLLPADPGRVTEAAAREAEDLLF
jgi:hypothetical protein